MIEFVDQFHGEELDQFVTNHPRCHFMQTSFWGKVKKDWEWFGIIDRSPDGQIRGTMALLAHKIRVLGCCIMYAPRGPIYDDGDMNTFDRLIEAAKQLSIRHKAYILRIDPMIEESDTSWLSHVEELGFSLNNAVDFSLFQPRMCYVLDMKGYSPETIDQVYSRTTRYKAHLAQRRGITVTLGGNDDIEDFSRLMELTGKHSGFVPRSSSYFRAFLNELSPWARLYLAKQDGKTIAVAMMVTLGERAWYMYGASDPDFRNTNHPNELLQWRMHQDAIRAGCRWFDFRGAEGYPDEDNPKIGLHQFKQRLGGVFHAYVGQLDYVFSPMMVHLVDLYTKVKKDCEL